MFSPRLSKVPAREPGGPDAKRSSGLSAKGAQSRGIEVFPGTREGNKDRHLWNFSGISVFPPDGKGSIGALAERMGIRQDTVRVRSSADAVAFLNKNRAAAATIDPSTVLVRPEDRENTALLSHELIHVAQLRRGVSQSVAEAERSARLAAQELLHGRVPHNVGSGAPPPLFLRLTGGQFDEALDNVGGKDAAVKLLKKSPSFMEIVRGLDKHYVSLSDPKYLPTDAMKHGKLTSGAFKGRRVLYMQGGANEGSFTPFDSPDATLSADLIKINNGSGSFEMVRSIAHEATHAFHYVTGAPMPKDIEALIQAGVTEEIKTRESEVRVVKEIYPARSSGRQAVDENVAGGYLSRPLVERDIAPDIGLTYLESSGFSALMNEAQRNDGLTDEQATHVREEIDKGPKKKFPMVKGKHGYDEPSSYAFLYFHRKEAIEIWRKFHQEFAGREASPEALKKKERQLQENAKILLDGRITYSPLPRS